MKSIRSRLLLFIVPATTAALLMAAAGVDRVVTRDLEAARDKQLLLLAQGIGSSLDMEIDGAVEFELEDGEMPELEASAGEGFYAIASETGELLFASAPPPAGLFSPAKETPFYFHAESPAGRMRFCVISIFREPETGEEALAEWLEENPGEELQAAGPQWFRVAAALPDKSLQSTIRTVRRTLFFGFGMLGLVTIIIPVWATGLALKPLLRLSRQADAVGADNPAARLEHHGVDSEVHSLVLGLNSALDRLAAAYEQQKRFTADAAHELRSPLSAIRAQCEVNLRKERSSKELKQVLESVHRTTLRLGEVVESLLALSRLQNGSAAIQRENLDLASLTHEVAGLLQPLAESRGVLLQEGITGEIQISGDRRLLLECLTNIIDNAIRYTPPEGQVTISGGAGPQPWIAVTDSGPGIAAENREKIFERFYRVDASRPRGEGGSGLGLSISRAVARLHGGDVFVESGPDGGSRFTLRFA